MFVDTNVLVALVHNDDPLHEQAERVMKSVSHQGAEGSPFTSDYVVAEGLNFLRRKVRDEQVARDFIAAVFGRQGVPTPFGEPLRVHGAVFAEAMARYQVSWGAGLSFTDWTNLVLMERHEIPAIATFDGGFEAWARVVR